MLQSLAFAAGTPALLLVVWRLLRLAFDRGAAEPNSARSVAVAGEVLGVFLVAAAAAGGCVRGDDLLGDAARVAPFGVAGVVLLVVASRRGTDLLLRGRLREELASGNVAAGVVVAGHAVATGLIVGGLFYGDDYAALGPAFVFFVVAQASLHLLVLLFRALTSYDDVEEVLGENLAAALSYAGVTVAVGVLVGHAANGPFAGWFHALRDYGVALGFGLALYPIRQVLVQSLILGARPTLRGGAIDVAIARGRDVGLGALEAATYVATAMMVSALS
jgi:uncharacterized membrane protein YjfL (UPF0719 family)